MKDSISKHDNHQERIDEIFGKIARFFSSSNKNDGITGSYKKKGKTSLINLSDKDKEEFARRADIDFQLKVQNQKNKLLDPSFCDPAYVEKSTKSKKNKKPEKKGRISYLFGGGISINGDKNIIDYSDVYIENTIRGEGMGSFRKIGVKDFVCYDINRDLYGIGWLFHDDASYDAKKISGKLYANRLNQPLNFDGEWHTGKFYGKISGSQALNRLKPALSKKDLLDKFSQLQELIKKTKNNFDIKLGLEDFNEIKKNIYSSSNKKLKDLFPEITKIKEYLLNFDVLKGFGNAPYIKSNELYNLKSDIDNNKDNDDTILQLDELIKTFKIIDSKINNFWQEYKKLLSSPPNTQQGKIKV